MKCVFTKLVNYRSSPESRRGSNFGLASPFRRRMHVTPSRPCFAKQRHTAFLVSRVPLLDELKGGAREQEDERELNDRPHRGHRVIEAFFPFVWVFFCEWGGGSLAVAGGVSAMAVMGRFVGAWVGRFVTLLLLLQLCVGDDIVHNDDQEPKQPGCNNSYVLVSHLYRLLPLPTEATNKKKKKRF